MGLQDIFSEENILKYSEACLELGLSIPRVWKRRNLDTLVIPSRGAVPFFLGTCYGLNKLITFGGEHEEFYKNMGVQDIIASLAKEELKISQDVKNKKIKVIIVPFTADLNIPKFNSELDGDEFVSKTRDYWAKVTATFFKENGERKTDPYFKSFTDFILRDLEKRGELAEAYEGFPKINRFALIDTVISGRASNDILKSFDNLANEFNNPNLKPYAFLIVDENGRKLKPQFTPYLQLKRLREEIETQQIPRIVSEDEGASLLGVASVVYPSVMDISRHFKLNGKPFFVGAGSWHPGYDVSEIHKESFRKFMGMIYAGIEFSFSKNYAGSGNVSNKNKFLEARGSFLDYRSGRIKAFYLGKEADLRMFELRRDKYTPENVYETKSHVVHIPFDEKSTQKARENLERITGAKFIPPKEDCP